MLRIGFGTWPLGGRAYGEVTAEAALAAIREAVRLGVRLFDTADIYGAGRAERLLGEALVDVPDAVIVSKAGYLSETGSDQDFSESHLRRALEASLERLRRPCLDVLLLHSPPAEALRSGEATAALERLRDQGLVRRVGVSLRSLETAQDALAWEAGSVIEVIFNLLDQRPLDCGLLEQCRQRGIDVIARVPLCFGVLSGKYEPGVEFPAQDQRSRWAREQMDRWILAARRFRFLEREGRSLGQAALAFCIAAPGTVYAIPGMKSVAQVCDNAGAAEPRNALCPEELAQARSCWGELRDLPPR